MLDINSLADGKAHLVHVSGISFGQSGNVWGTAGIWVSYEDARAKYNDWVKHLIGRLLWWVLIKLLIKAGFIVS